jgi:hypothetical protein
MEAGYGGQFSIWNLHVWRSNLLALVPCFFPMRLLKETLNLYLSMCSCALTFACTFPFPRTIVMWEDCFDQNTIIIRTISMLHHPAPSNADILGPTC